MAVKGMLKEIRDHEKTVRKGYKLLEDVKNGKPIKTDKTVPEIKEVIRQHESLIEYIDEQRNALLWEIQVENQEGSN
ncbi:hypothetical protein [Thalassobacillus sp. B23F22_16]|uniref:hypothetical protein n=1 Tax=Thalassobacillus sp. B23F22_16 TaxID=3459513 RepID=UPI00373E67D9